ncbi:MAG: M20 family metallopeptidase [Vicinamibacterales bacterium]
MTSADAFCRSNIDWLLDLVEELSTHESPTDDKAAVDRCGRRLAERLNELGAVVTCKAESIVGNHLIATFGTGLRQILLLGHMDTVWPVGQLEHMPIKREHGRLHGPGVFDMKAGIGIAALATRAVLARRRLDGARLVMLWTADEETGSETSRTLIEAEARKSDAVLVFEPALTDGGLKTSRKGCGQYELVAHGIAAHAGLDPRKGVSAIREIARQILALETLQDLDRGISVNVGLVMGGSRPNVVAEEARVTIDVRVPTKKDADRFNRAIHALAPQLSGARITVTGGFERPPMERTKGVAQLFAVARSVADELDMTLTEGSTGGGSDGNFTTAIGIPTLDGLGAIGDGAHALHEHVKIEALAPKAALVAGIIERLLVENPVVL